MSLWSSVCKHTSQCSLSSEISSRHTVQNRALKLTDARLYPPSGVWFHAENHGVILSYVSTIQPQFLKVLPKIREYRCDISERQSLGSEADPRHIRVISFPSVILIFKFEVIQAVIISLYISQSIGRCVSAVLSSAIGTGPLGIYLRECQRYFCEDAIQWNGKERSQTLHVSIYLRWSELTDENTLLIFRPSQLLDWLRLLDYLRTPVSLSCVGGLTCQIREKLPQQKQQMPWAGSLEVILAETNNPPE